MPQERKTNNNRGSNQWLYLLSIKYFVIGLVIRLDNGQSIPLNPLIYP
jgi:hypothetical protein